MDLESVAQGFQDSSHVLTQPQIFSVRREGGAVDRAGLVTNPPPCASSHQGRTSTMSLSRVLYIQGLGEESFSC